MMLAEPLHPDTFAGGESRLLDDPVGQQVGYSSALRAVRIVVRRKWVVLATIVVAGGAAIAFSLQQEALYSSSSQVLLKNQNLASGLTGLQDLSTGHQDPHGSPRPNPESPCRRPSRSGSSGGQVPGLDPEAFLGMATVTAYSNADILDFQLTYGDAETAELLATLHAQEFIAHRRELDTEALVAARKELAAGSTSFGQTELRRLAAALWADRERATAPHDGGAADRERLAPASRESAPHRYSRGRRERPCSA